MLKKSDLHPYQQNIIEKAKQLPSMGLLLDLGMGKTPTMLTIISESEPGRTLVIAPLQIAKTVWHTEAAKWQHTKDLKFSLIIGSEKQRLAALEAKADIFVINVENTQWLVENWPTLGFNILVIDESSRFKNASSQRFKAIKKVLPQFKRRFIMTGSPTPNGYENLWAQVGILDLGARLEKSLTKYRATYFEPESKNHRTNVVYKYRLKTGAAEVIEKLISDICFSLKSEDYLQLPKLSDIRHPLVLDAKVMTKYKELKKEMVTEIKGQEITAVSAAALTNKLLQFTSGAVYDLDKSTNLVHNEKLDFLAEIMEDSRQPTLIFYHYKHTLSRLQERFPEAEILSDQNLQKWRDGRIKTYLAHPASAGIGINAQCNQCDFVNVVWADLPFSSELYQQSNKRVHRQGQTKPVILHHLIAKGTIDEHVLKVLENKISIQDALLDSLKA